MASATVKKPKARLNEAGFRRHCERLNLYGDTAIAAHIGVDQSTVYRIRSGLTQPSTDFIFDTLDAFPAAKFEELFIRPANTSSGARKKNVA